MRHVHQLELERAELELVPGSQVLERASRSLCSSSFERAIAIVSRPPYTGR